MADQINEYFDPKLNKQLEEFNAEIDKSVKGTLELISATKKLLVVTDKVTTSTDKNEAKVKELTAAEKQAAKIAKEQEVLQKKILVTKTSLNAQRKKEIDALDKVRLKEKQHNDALKLVVRTEAEAVRQNKALRIERGKVDKTTTTGIAKIKQYNAQINSNTALLKRNTDINQQRINGIGLYQNALKGLQTAFFAVTGAIVALNGAFRVGIQVINSTQTSGDALAVTMGGIENGWEAVKKSIATGTTLKDLIFNINTAVAAGKEYVALLDDLGDRQRDLTITEKEARRETEQLKQVVDNVNLANAERLAAADRIFQIETDLAAQRKSLADQELLAETNKLESLTGLNKAQTLDFIKNYDEQKELREKAIELARLEQEVEGNRAAAKVDVGFASEFVQAKQDLEVFVNSLTENESAYVEIFRKYGKTTDEELDRVVTAYGKAIDADIAYFSQTRRTANQRNVLLGQMAKAQEDTSSIIVNNVRTEQEEITRIVATEGEKQRNIFEETWKVQTGLKTSSAAIVVETSEDEATQTQAIAQNSADAITGIFSGSQQKQLAALEDKKERGIITETQYDKQRETIEKKAAQRNKLIVIGRIILEQLLGLSTLNFAKAAAAGAALITAIATPAYEMGGYHEGGAALTGEKGRELAIGENGKVMLTPDKPNIQNWGKTTFIPHLQTEQLLSGGNASHDNAQVVDAIDKVRKSLANQSQHSQKIGANFTEDVIKVGNHITKRRNKYYN